MIPLSYTQPRLARTGHRGKAWLQGGIVRGRGIEAVLARLVAAHEYDAAGSCSPRVEVWVAMTTDTLHPLIARGSGPSQESASLRWEWLSPRDLGLGDGADVSEVLADLRRRPRDLIETAGPRNDAEWPVLEFDSRYSGPRDEYPTVLDELRRARNTCPDDDVPAISALIQTMPALRRADDA